MLGPYTKSREGKEQYEKAIKSPPDENIERRIHENELMRLHSQDEAEVREERDGNTIAGKTYREIAGID